MNQGIISISHALCCELLQCKVSEMAEEEVGRGWFMETLTSLISRSFGYTVDQ